MQSPAKITIRILSTVIISVILLMTVSCASTRSITTTGGVVEIPGKEPTRHFLVFGFGIISLKPPEAETAVMAIDQTVLGLYAGNIPMPNFGVGYQQKTTTIVPDGLKADDIRIEVLRKPFEGLEIRPMSALLLKKNHNHNEKDSKDEEEK
jgi:hypothetical protein